MKIDLTHQPIEKQAGIVAAILLKRYKSGQKVTFADDLLTHVKHRGFGPRHRAKFVQHCNTLIEIGRQILAGKDVTKLIKEAKARAAIFQPDDEVMFGNEPGRVIEVLPEDKLRILSSGGPHIVLSRNVQPKPKVPMLAIGAATVNS